MLGVYAKEEWKRTLSFVVTLSREDQSVTVLRTGPAKGRRGGPKRYGIAYAEGC
jgi:hypothetical protein